MKTETMQQRLMPISSYQRAIILANPDNYPNAVMLRKAGSIGIATHICPKGYWDKICATNPDAAQLWEVWYG